MFLAEQGGTNSPRCDAYWCTVARNGRWPADADINASVQSANIYYINIYYIILLYHRERAERKHLSSSTALMYACIQSKGALIMHT